MIYDTIIARSNDGLPLCDVPSRDKAQVTNEMKQKLKEFLRSGKATQDVNFKQLGFDSSIIRCLYKTLDGLVYVVFFNVALNFKLACCYLDEIQQGFEEVFFGSPQEMKNKYGTANVNYRSKIETIERNDSYCFQTFERFVNKKKSDFADQNSSKNMERLKTEITELQNILQENIRLLVDRDDSLQKMTAKAKNLREDSKMFKDRSADLVWQIWLKKNSLWLIMAGFILCFLFFKFY